MLHEPANNNDVVDNDINYKATLGLKLFAAYGVFYLGFILINVLKPSFMKTEVLFGVNLAIIYGFTLIIVAIAMGLIYNAICTKKENEMNKQEAA
jgi:uncharacterized membrane protein (DUF485 family)